MIRLEDVEERSEEFGCFLDILLKAEWKEKYYELLWKASKSQASRCFGNIFFEDIKKTCNVVLVNKSWDSTACQYDIK